MAPYRPATHNGSPSPVRSTVAGWIVFMTSVPAGSGRRAALLEATLFTLVALAVYWITGPPADGDMWPPLAEAFVSGQLHLDQDRPWLELVPRPEGGQY